jgi:hypothetical protein
MFTEDGVGVLDVRCRERLNRILEGGETGYNLRSQLVVCRES